MINEGILGLLDRLEIVYAAKPLSPKQTERVDRLRQSIKRSAKNVATHAPSSREKSIALGKLEEALFWARAAIAREDSFDI